VTQPVDDERGRQREHDRLQPLAACGLKRQESQPPPGFAVQSVVRTLSQLFDSDRACLRIQNVM
jgi:hypothetical protein